jgi:hypothetical protein
VLCFSLDFIEQLNTTSDKLKAGVDLILEESHVVLFSRLFWTLNTTSGKLKAGEDVTLEDGHPDFSLHNSAFGYNLSKAEGRGRADR